MRRPPHLHVFARSPDLSPGLKPIDPTAWLTPDTEAHWLPEKHALMRAHRVDTFVGDNTSATEEAAAAILAVTQPPFAEWPTPLERAAASVSDDICILSPNADGLWQLDAASLVAPTFWSLGEKIGLPLSGLHAPVPGANPDMVARIQRIFDALRPGQILERFNWTVQASDARFTPNADPLKHLASTTPDANALDVLHLRVERQTITKLPQTGAVIFTIRIVLDPLRACLAEPADRAAFKAAWQATTPELSAYKGWPAYEHLVGAALTQLS